MTVERIQIEVSERGSRTVRRNLESIGSGAQKADSSVRLLQRSLQGFAAGAALRQIQQQADLYTNLQNRIRVVTKSNQELAVVTKELFEISNSTRSAYESTAEVYTRTALAVKDLGRSQAETLSFTKSLNQAVILSGAGVQEAKNALIQLSQGLASGILRGDELRSVLEQLPAVADIIAQGFNVTRGELKRMGEQGLISAQGIFKAFSQARVELEERFAKAVPTIAQSLQVLGNKALETLGSLDAASGVSRGVSRAILGLSNNFETLIRVVGAAAIAVGITFGIRAINLAIAGLARLTVAIARNPLGFLATALTTAIGFLVAFGDKLKLSSESFATFRDFGEASIEAVKEAFSGLPDFFRSNFAQLTTITQGFFENYDLSLKGFLEFTASSLDAFVGFWIGSYRAILAVFQNFGPALEDIFFQSLNGIVGLTENGINNIVDGLNVALGSIGIEGVQQVVLGRLENVASGAARSLGEAATEGFKSGFEFEAVGNSLQNLFERAEEIATERIKKQKKETEELAKARKELSGVGVNRTAPPVDEFQKLLDVLRQEAQLLRLNSREREILLGIFQAEDELKRKLTKSEKDIVESLLRQNQVLADQADLYESVNGPVHQYLANVEAVQELLEKGRISADQYKQTLRDLELQFLQSFQATGIADNFLVQLRTMQLESQTTFQEIGAQVAEIYGPGGVVSQAIGDAIGQAIVFGDSLQESVHRVAATITSELISALVQTGINMLLNATIARGAQAVTVAATTAAAASVASAWVPAAALASLATLGTNSPAAIAGITSTLASTAALTATANTLNAIPGFLEGGFTGNLPKSSVAGLVHGQEFVFDAATTRRNRSTFEAIQAGKEIPSTRPMNVTVVNQFGAQAEIDVQQNGEDVEITVRRLLQQEAPGIIAADLTNPNSRTSKALKQNTTTRRRYT